LTFSSEYLAPYTNSTKQKYKPVAKKVHAVIGELPEKFCKGNLTNLRRELHLSLAKGNPK
jgi:hypothetical protein